MERSQDFKTPLGRAAFTQHLFKPQEKDDGKKQYGFTLLIPKTTPLVGRLPQEDGKPARDVTFDEMIVEAGEKEWGAKFKQMIKDGLIKNPVLDGDGPQGVNKKTGVRHDGYAGHWFIRPTSGEKFPPRLVNQQAQLGISQEDLYSGCYVYAVINAYTWENPKNGKGISFGVSMVQKAKEGGRLGGGGGVDVDKWAEKIDDEGDAPAATKTGAGAGGLFG